MIAVFSWKRVLTHPHFYILFVGFGSINASPIFAKVLSVFRANVQFFPVYLRWYTSGLSSGTCIITSPLRNSSTNALFFVLKSLVSLPSIVKLSVRLLSFTFEWYLHIAHHLLGGRYWLYSLSVDNIYWWYLKTLSHTDTSRL